MKKIIAILLVMMMIMGMSTTVFADDAILTIDAGSGDRTYSGHKLLNLSISLKSTDNCAGAHKDECYNYSYTVNETYRTYLQDEVFASLTDKPESSALITDEQILDYLVNQSGDAEDGSFGTLRDVADRLYRAIKEDNVAAEENNMSGNADTIAQGYWLIVDTTDMNGIDNANSLVLLDTKGESAITIEPKVDLPQVVKKVKDIDDTVDSDIDDNPWVDSADHDMEDAVPFKLTATLPSNVGYYESYQIVFHDTLDAGLELDDTTLKVYMYDNAAAAETDVEVVNGTDVTADFVLGKDADNCSFDVSCEDILAIEDVTADSVFVVYYEAELGENAEIGTVGNVNKVYLEYSNDPYDTDATGKTEEDKVIVFTYQVVINKVDEQNAPLEGADFTLYKWDPVEDKFVEIGKKLVDDAGDTFTWAGLDDGKYKLAETTVPDGYTEMKAIEFSIAAEHDLDSQDPKLTSLDGTDLEAEINDGTLTKDIVNKTGTVLPETGAKGTMMLLSISFAVVLGAAVLMITRKKMSVYED